MSGITLDMAKKHLDAWLEAEDSYLKVAINLDEKIGKGIANKIILPNNDRASSIFYKSTKPII